MGLGGLNESWCGYGQRSSAGSTRAIRRIGRISLTEMHTFRIAAALALATVLAAPAMPARAQDPNRPPGGLARAIEQEVTYQMAGSALAVATLCAASPAWQDYDAAALAAAYRTSRDYLDEYAPGRRIYAEAQTILLLHNLGADLDLKRCPGLAPALLAKYRPRP